MKIESRNNRIILSEVFNGVTIKTQEGKEIHICLRDFGWDMKINNGEWHHVDNDQDFKKKKFVPVISNQETEAKSKFELPAQRVGCDSCGWEGWSNELDTRNEPKKLIEEYNSDPERIGPEVIVTDDDNYDCCPNCGSMDI